MKNGFGNEIELNRNIINGEVMGSMKLMEKLVLPYGMEGTMLGITTIF